MRMAHIASTRTNCMKRAVGCIIVSNNRVVATGYNGTPFGIKNCCDGGCARCNTNTPSGLGLDECLCIHAEINAIIECGRQKILGGTAYVTTKPCLSCTKSLLQAGIKRIVFDRQYPLPAVEKLIEATGGSVTLERVQVNQY